MTNIIWKIETVETGAFSTELYIAPVKENIRLSPEQLETAKSIIHTAFTSSVNKDWLEAIHPWNNNHCGIAGGRTETRALIVKLNKS
jgi:hypothetical protein